MQTKDLEDLEDFPGQKTNMPLQTVYNEIKRLVNMLSGEPRKDDATSLSIARNLWIPTINNHGGFGRWKIPSNH